MNYSLEQIDRILDNLSRAHYLAIVRNDGITKRIAALEIHCIVRDEWLAAYRDMRQIEMEVIG